jgi:hypothetical protein
VHVGQPLNLTMNLQATGLGYDTLPALSLPSVDGATVYPDKPVTSNHTDGQWIIGQRKQSFAVVPERAGIMSIPATTLKWWNVQTDRMEVAQIPAHSVTVLPAVGGAALPPVPAAVAPAGHSAPVAPTVIMATRSTPWRWIAIGSVGLWLSSMLAWWWWRRRRSTNARDEQPQRTTPRGLQQAFLSAARDGDTVAQTRSLLAWAQAERPLIQHLGQLSAALGDDKQRASISALQQRRYAGVPMPEDRAKLAEAFARGFVWSVAGRNDDDPDLPPLYPFKLR